MLLGSLYFFLTVFSADTRRLSNAGMMLVHRLRRWASIIPALEHVTYRVYRVTGRETISPAEAKPLKGLVLVNCNFHHSLCLC